jgi:photosystem II stability/assembly factor-like uncharacterized protein
MVSSFAQPWADLMTKGDKASFEEAKNQFKEYWKDKAPEKGKGFKPFLRWQNYWEDRLMPDGTLPKAGTTEEEFKAYRKARGFADVDVVTSALTPVGNWAPLGPTTSTGGYAGIGRINCIAFDPGNSSVIYIGSAGGGVWKTTNGGTSWTALTDFVGSLGASDILVDPANPNTLYLATGDGDGRDSPSIGVLKSTDGGASWSATGLNWVRSDLRYIRRLVKNGSRILAATSVGVYYSDDAGASWTISSLTANCFDLEQMPGSAGTFYATAVTGTTGEIYRSTDNGATWSSVRSLTGTNRIAIAVSPANANFVCAVFSKSSDSGFNGFHASTDGGTSWTIRATTPNLLGWNATGNDAGGQGWYDLCLVVDPTNANTIYLGGVNTWKSTNGGTSWTINTMWTTSSSAPTVHADKHALVFQNNTTLFQGNDGGIYRTTNGGTSWTDLTNSMAISQLYRLGVAQTNSSIIGGLQDNGTKLRSSTGVWTDEIGGDGMDCAINPSNASFMYGELYYGEVYRSSNAGASWSLIQPSTTEQGGWITPYVLAPSAPSTMYIGYKNIWKSTTATSSRVRWTKMGTNSSTGPSIRAIAVAPNDANVVYYSFDADMATPGQLRKSTNGGSSWTTLTNPTNVGRIGSIAIDNTNSNNVWVTVSGYNAGQKVFRSTNGGTSWTNVSGTLPNIPSNCVIYSNGSNGGLYLGMDVGVYYRDNTMSDWVLFNAQLPNVEIADLEIQYSLGKLRAATYGRGVWESDLYGTTPFIAPELSAKLSEKELLNSNFKVYPNPAQDVLNVEFYAAESGPTRLYLVDMLGRLQQKTQVVDVVKGHNKVNLQINDLPNGVYYLTNGKGKSMRFVKSSSSAN